MKPCAVLCVLSVLALASGCAQTVDKGPEAGYATSPGQSPVTKTATQGSFTFKCGSKGRGSRQNETYQRDKDCSRSPGPLQVLTFRESGFSNVDVHVDCSQRTATAAVHEADVEPVSLQLEPDGHIRGTLRYDGQLANDGRGNEHCGVQFEVIFDGVADCRDGEDSPRHIAVSTTVNFNRLSDPPPGGLAQTRCEIVNPCPLEAATDYSCRN